MFQKQHHLLGTIVKNCSNCQNSNFISSRCQVKRQIISVFNNRCCWGITNPMILISCYIYTRRSCSWTFSGLYFEIKNPKKSPCFKLDQCICLSTYIFHCFTAQISLSIPQNKLTSKCVMFDIVNLGEDISSPVLPQSGYFILGINCKSSIRQYEMIFLGGVSRVLFWSNLIN